VTTLSFDRQSLSYENVEGDGDSTYKSTSLNLLGVDASSPSQLPRFALDYVIMAGVTAGVSAMFATRSLSLDVDSGQPPEHAPTTARSEGTTFLGGARVGWAYAVDETFAFWPRVGLTYAVSTGEYERVVNQTTGAIQNYDLSSRYLDLNIEALGVVSPVEHTAILIGPYLDLGLYGKSVVEVPVDVVEGGEDSRDAKLTSFGLVIHAVGYY